MPKDMIPIGSIILWSGTLETIPDGWQLCDGTNGTPNLAFSFVRGASPFSLPGSTGGEASHSHPFSADSHSHSNGGSVGVPGTGPDLAWDAANDSQGAIASGTTGIVNNQPPWYSLAYIQRLV